jgi:lipocalin
MSEFIYATLAAYAVTFVVASSAIMDRPRFWLMKRTPRLMSRGKHMLECRMCSGFWISAVVGIWFDVNILAVYGASYFLATQERG